MENNVVKRFIDYRLDDVKCSGAAAGAAAIFVGLEGLGHFFLSERHYPDHYFTIDAGIKEGVPVRPLVKQLMALVGSKKAKKSFSKTSGQVSYAIEGPLFRVHLAAGAPAQCTVEEYTEEVTTPALPEKKEMLTRYRLTDPKCLETGNSWGRKKTGLEQDVDKETAAVKAAVAADAETADSDELQAASDMVDKLGTLEPFDGAPVAPAKEE